MAQDPEISAAEANFFIMRKHLEDHPDGGATLKRLEEPDGPPTAAQAVRRFMERRLQRPGNRRHRGDRRAL